MPPPPTEVRLFTARWLIRPPLPASRLALNATGLQSTRRRPWMLPSSRPVMLPKSNTLVIAPRSSCFRSMSALSTGLFPNGCCKDNRVMSTKPSNTWAVSPPPSSSRSSTQRSEGTAPASVPGNAGQPIAWLNAFMSTPVSTSEVASRWPAAAAGDQSNWPICSWPPSTGIASGRCRLSMPSWLRQLDRAAPFSMR